MRNRDIVYNHCLRLAPSVAELQSGLHYIAPRACNATPRSNKDDVSPKILDTFLQQRKLGENNAVVSWDLLAFVALYAAGP